MAAASSILTVYAAVVAGNAVGTIAGPIVKEAIGLTGGLICGVGSLVGSVVKKLASSSSEKTVDSSISIEEREMKIIYLMKKYGCSREVAEYILDNRRLPSINKVKIINENSDWVFLD
jgi:hypothetical protein